MVTMTQSSADSLNAIIESLNDAPPSDSGADPRFAGLPAEIQTAIRDTVKGGTVLGTVSISNGKDGLRYKSITATLVAGDDPSWRPAGTGTFEAFVAGASKRAANEYAGLLATLAAVRGGCVAAIPFGYKADARGFLKVDYARTIAGLERASFQLPPSTFARFDPRIRVVATDNGGTERAGFILVRFYGFKNKRDA